MRIFSKFHDFYDGVQAHGFEDRIVYERTTEEIKLWELGKKDEELYKKFLPSSHYERPQLIYCENSDKKLKRLWNRRVVDQDSKWFRYRSYRGGNGEILSAVLYFCGKMYPFYMVKVKLNQFEDGYIYSFEPGFEDYVKQREWRADKKLPPWADVLAAHMGKEIDPQLHFELKCPSVLYIGDYVVMNPILSEFKIQKLIDAYTAYQELEMFLGGVMGDTNFPPSPMSDKEKILSHGMDTKLSFRKPKKT